MVEHSGVTSRYSSLHLLAALLVVSVGVTACAKLDGAGPGLAVADAPDAGKPAGPPGLGSAETGKPASLQELAKRHADAPGDARVAVRYARLLKRSGRSRDALKALETAAANGAGDDRALLVERGLLALELGQAARAKELLAKAETQGARDWHVVSGLGVAESTLGQHGDAQRHFASALALSPDNPTVLNNLAISYLLDNKVPQAEATLKRAAKAKAADARVTQNLNLVASLKPAPDDGSTPVTASAPAAASEAAFTSPMGLTNNAAGRRASGR